MNTEGKRIVMALDVSTATIGVCILLDDGSKYGKIIELTHVSPKISNKIKGIESLFLKKRIFSSFLEKYKDIGIDSVVIEEPLLSSNNVYTCATLLRFNGMVSDSIYDMLGIVPEYISSHDAREYAFPDLMAIRKYAKDGTEYPYNKIIKSIEKANFVLFGGYPWEIDKKTILQSKVASLFPDIKWIYDKKGELTKENFDASDSYVAALGWLNKERHGEPIFKTYNIASSASTDGPTAIDYDVSYWNEMEHRTTYLN